MPNEAVLFRGTREGIHIYFNDEYDFPQVVNSLEDRLSDAGAFFRGARIVINTGRRSLSAEQVETVRQVLNKHDGVQLLRLEQAKPEPAEGEMTALVVERTVRSGQQFYHPGHVVVIGDVNPGGEVIADGNIVILGVLRGSAHGGYSGRKDAIVAATVMAPTQVSISGVWARQPDDPVAESTRGIPEVARLRDDRIVIEPYLPGQD
ncbi:MAG: septum site-determining protein MinC [Bacillota bacterium]